MNFDSVLSRHERIALQFSGGKDSIAVLYVMKPYWDRVTVYFCNSGDPLPETLEIWNVIRDMVPNSVEIQGARKETASSLGLPSDVVPTTSTWYGRNIAGDTGFPIVDRYTCCLFSIMQPLHDQMVKDGVTLIIRGQRNADKNKSPVRSGDVKDGIEFLFPIQEWSDREVFDYLTEVSAPVPPYYDAGMSSAPDCLGCTAWLEHGLPQYLKKKHPAQSAVTTQNLVRIARAVRESSKILEKYDVVL